MKKVMKNWSEYLESKDLEWMNDVYLSEGDVEFLQIRLREMNGFFDEELVEVVSSTLDSIQELYSKDDLTDEECVEMDALMFDVYAYSK